MSNTEPMHQYLLPSACIDSDHPAIIELAQSLYNSALSDLENAVAMYYYVRDQILYNPYSAEVTVDGLKASAALKAREAWCVPKAALLAALCRASGIPARLGFADVVNHLSTERLRQSMNTDVFYFHGYCSIYLNHRWVKSTPAFNLSLCEKFQLKPLEFDGISDSLYHQFDQQGNRHMEYVHERGEYLDVPLQEMRDVFSEYYPSMDLSSGVTDDAAQWHDDVQNETKI